MPCVEENKVDDAAGVQGWLTGPNDIDEEKVQAAQIATRALQVNEVVYDVERLLIGRTGGRPTCTKPWNEALATDLP